jgi:molecular chaperone GrpE
MPEFADPGGVEQPTEDPAAARDSALEDQLRFALADLDNLRKRFGREVDRERLAEGQRVARLWLPVLDNLDLALQHSEPEDSAVLEGINSIRDEALAVLTQLGYPRFDDVGEPFDPMRHEAMGTLEVEDQPSGTIVAAVRPGYGGDVVLRPAGVMVARQPG